MQVPRKHTVEIDFRNITYTIRKKKTILNGVNGHFRSGNLIGILGPSGAGKTTLLNILAGYIHKDVSGVINVNGQARDMQKFKKLSCYIMQEDVVQKQLSVGEIMMLAANLKLESKFTTNEKRKIINSVVDTIGLKECIETRTENLSGGQTKRLAVALEMISNPPVVFLDEPTTGLDYVAAKQCIELLKTLANQGRTIICTIHQPPDSLFCSFDQVYFMSDGYCIYNGSVSQMVSFLESVNSPCPTNYSPADYIIELVSNNGETIQTLSKAVQNGLLTIEGVETKKYPMTIRHNTCDNIFQTRYRDSYERFPNPFHLQFIILLKRMFIQMSRNKLMLAVQLIHHVISSLSLGFCFFWIGDNASQALANFKFFIGIIVFYCYTYIMSPALLFPFEIELIRREYFNRWYSLKAYYAALTISTIPSTIVLCVVFNIIIYTLTNQPMETMRFFLFNVICILVSLNSYGLGITIGSIFNSTTGALVGSTIGIYMIAICIHGMGYGESISTFMKVLMFMPYPRHGLTGLSVALLRERPLMNCTDELFCFIRDPEEVLEIMGMANVKLDFTIGVLVVTLIIHRLTAFVALKFKVTPDARLLSKYL